MATNHKFENNPCMNQWKEVKLGEIGKIITGKTPSRKNPEHFGENIPFVTPTDFRNYQKNIYKAERYLSKSGKSMLSGKVLPIDSVLVTCIGSDMGKVAINKVECITNQQINAVVVDQSQIDSNYLYYTLVNLQAALRQWARDGTTMPIINKGTFEQLPIALPPLSEQKAIADILSCFDDKIELNDRMTQTLEATTQAIFKSWFVDFEPFIEGVFAESELGRIPAGWSVSSLEEVCHIKYGKNLPISQLTPKGYPVFGGNGVIGCYSDYLYAEPQVLISCRGAASGKVLISNPYSFITNNSLVLEIKGSLNFEYLRYYCFNHPFEKYVTGSAQPQITIETIKNVKILIPPEEILDDFQKTVQNISLKSFANHQQNRTLAKIRDSLRPKLFNFFRYLR